jgi:hypothetical protein
MAINGITESFITSVATTKDLARQSRAMILFSLIFLGISWTLLQLLGLSGEGLVWANCVNLGVRILWSCRFITTWYREREATIGWERVVPRSETLAAAVGVGAGVWYVCGRGTGVYEFGGCCWSRWIGVGLLHGSPPLFEELIVVHILSGDSSGMHIV